MPALSHKSLGDRSLSIWQYLIIVAISSGLVAISFNFFPRSVRWSEFSDFVLQITLLVIVGFAFWYFTRGYFYKYIGIEKIDFGWVVVSLVAGCLIFSYEFILFSEYHSRTVVENLSEFENWKEFRFLLALFLTAVIVGPVLEEFVIRGAFISSLLTRLSPSIAVLVQSVVWSSLHFSQENYLILVDLFVFGVVLGVLRVKSGSIFPGLISHSVVNLSWLVYWLHFLPNIGIVPFG